jgi:hypothetical protein
MIGKKDAQDNRILFLKKSRKLRNSLIKYLKVLNNK